MTNALTASEAVAQGAQVLDEKYPGWYRDINLEALDISDCFRCVCGQLGGSLLIGESHPYKSFLKALDLPRFEGEYGFDTLWNRDLFGPQTTYEQLDYEWTQAIEARLALDRLPAEKQAQELLAV
jgi:hypothetical protein